MFVRPKWVADCDVFVYLPCNFGSICLNWKRWMCDNIYIYIYIYIMFECLEFDPLMLNEREEPVYLWRCGTLNCPFDIIYWVIVSSDMWVGLMAYVHNIKPWQIYLYCILNCAFQFRKHKHGYGHGCDISNFWKIIIWHSGQDTDLTRVQHSKWSVHAF